jgi:excisionase family DNA binding protein
MEKYLRPSEVARLLKLNTETVYHYIKKGDLPAARLGRKYIVTEKDLERFIQRRKEAYRTEKMDLSEKGKEMVEKARENAERVLDFVVEFPGATQKELEEALELDEKDAGRALRKLESQGQVHREGDADQAEGSEVMWYAGGETK